MLTRIDIELKNELRCRATFPPFLEQASVIKWLERAKLLNAGTELTREKECQFVLHKGGK